ncbi:hypothetical protein ACERK3_09155 [Phycisphaerales bacterium AB-hyl4]|uniref:Uncharacterized protein n=1 Tax=Natronomicrosphaera hydrolytica TaxID=3242702 RepID=A0ABV4U4J6_9BACT
MKDEKHQFVICIRNEQNPASLQKRKLYRVVDPLPNDPEGYLRIIDEEEEDYLYPREWFMAVDLPKAAIEALEAA